MEYKKTQRFVKGKEEQKIIPKRRYSLIYVLTGILVLLLSLIPISGAIVLVLWGVEVIDASLGMAIVLIVVGCALLLAMLTGTIIFAIYYFTNDTERKLREIKYKDGVKLEDIFMKCEQCGATLLIHSEVCPKCGYKIENDNEKEKIDKLNEYLIDNYNFEISDRNIEIINSYVNSKVKKFEYSHEKIKNNDVKMDMEQKVKESILNKFIFNFKQIVLTCSLSMLGLIVAFLLIGKYLLGL